MKTPYLQSYVLVLEDSSIEVWSGYAENKEHGKGLAIEYVVSKTGQQVWDMCCMPVTQLTKVTKGYN